MKDKKKEEVYLINNLLAAERNFETWNMKADKPGPTLKLWPGINNVPKKLMDKVLEFHAEEFEDSEDFDIIGGLDSPDVYEDLKPKAKIKLIKETFNPELLLKWESDEKDGKVRKAIKLQLEPFDL